jgi:hypothetical protein
MTGSMLPHKKINTMKGNALAVRRNELLNSRIAKSHNSPSAPFSYAWLCPKVHIAGFRRLMTVPREIHGAGYILSSHRTLRLLRSFLAAS